MAVLCWCRFCFWFGQVLLLAREVKLKKVFVDDAFSGWYSCQSNLTRPYGKEAPVCIRSNGRAFAHESVVHSVSREVIS